MDSCNLSQRKMRKRTTVVYVKPFALRITAHSGSCSRDGVFFYPTPVLPDSLTFAADRPSPRPSGRLQTSRSTVSNSLLVYAGPTAYYCRPKVNAV
jgi:hypothetical protein